MGTYCVFYCRKRKEYIDPDEINDGACKPHQVMHREDVGRVLMMLLVFGPYEKTSQSWYAVEMTADEYPHSNEHPSHEEITNNEWNTREKNAWVNVTKQAIEH